MRLVSCALFVVMFFMNYYNNVSGVEMSYIDSVFYSECLFDANY